MKQKANLVPFPTAESVYLAASAINNLIQVLPTGTAYFIGVVLVVMLTGQLAQAKGSLARAVFPFVSHLKWGWHSCQRALERGALCLDTFFDLAYQWCLQELEAEVVCLGSQAREVQAVDSSTIARFRARKRLEAAGKGYWGRAGKAVRANIVAAVTSVVIINGVRLGLVRRTRFGDSCEAAVAQLWSQLPGGARKRLLVVDAGIASKEQFAQATTQDALLGRLRINGKLYCPAPASQQKRQRGRPRLHGQVLHPGWEKVEVEPAEELWIEGEQGPIRLRRWNQVHYQEYPTVEFDIVRVDDPAFDKPLVIGSTARELSTAEFLQGYKMRSTIETNFYVAQDSAAMEMPRAFVEKAVTRRISLALLAGSLLKAIAAKSAPIAIGPWDRKPQRTGGRLAHHLSQRASIFAELALKGIAPRNYRKNQNDKVAEDLRLGPAA